MKKTSEIECNETTSKRISHLNGTSHQHESDANALHFAQISIVTDALPSASLVIYSEILELELMYLGLDVYTIA